MRSPTSADSCGLTVVIPAYNEEAALRAGVLAQVRDFLDTCGVSSEVIVVDDGSVDGTAELVRAFIATHRAFRLVQTHHGGKAHALVHGMLAASGRIVLFSDIDQAIPIAEAARILPWFDEGFDIVIGSRGFQRDRATLSRRAVSYGQLVARYGVLGFGDIIDTQCGFKAFRRAIVKPLIGRLVVYAGARDVRVSGARLSPGFDVELLFAAKKLGLAIKEVSVQCDHRRGRPARFAQLFRDCVRGFHELLAIRAAARYGQYDIDGPPAPLPEHGGRR